jgi:hypothetical protein
MAVRILTPLEHRMIDFAEKHPHVQGDASLFHELVAEFGWRKVAYLQRLYQLVDDPAAVAARPVEVNRIRRVRDEKAEQRASRSFARAS